MLYQPHIAPLIHSLPRSRLARRVRAILTDLLLTDALPDDVGRRAIERVEVWENERLDPAITAKASAGTTGVPPGSWSYRHLRAGERLPWVKVTLKEHDGHARRRSTAGGGKSEDRSLLSQLAGAGGSGGRSDRDDVSSNGTSAGSPSVSSSAASTATGALAKSPWLDPHDSLPRPSANGTSGSSGSAGGGAEEGGTAAALKLKEGWKWVPGEEWMVDMCAEWCEAGADDEGWVYSDDSWQVSSLLA